MTNKISKLLIFIFGVVALALIVQILAFGSGSNYYISPTSSHHTDEFLPTETFSGQINNVPAIFKHQDYTKYQLTLGDTITTGELNTERGYGSDPDATVFVLNWQKPESEQKYFVRLTTDPTSIVELDSTRALTSQTLHTTSEMVLPNIVGGDKDEHGCIGSAGYSWCESKNECLREWEEPCLQ